MGVRGGGELHIICLPANFQNYRFSFTTGFLQKQKIKTVIFTLNLVDNSPGQSIYLNPWTKNLSAARFKGIEDGPIPPQLTG